MTTVTELDTLLADLNDDVPPMTDDAFTAGRTRLRAAMTRPAPHRRRHFPILVAAAASILAIGTTVALTSDDTAGPGAVGNPTELAAWAKTLADDPPRVAPGQYLYERIHNVIQEDLDDDPRFRVEFVNTGEQWVPYDYRDEWRFRADAQVVDFVRGTEDQAEAEGITVPPPADAADWTEECGAYARNKEDEPCDGNGWGYTGSPEFYAPFTGDPARLYRVLDDRAREAGDHTPAGVFTQADLLLQPGIPNAFRATLYEAVSHIPQLTITENARTSDGRTGIGLTVRGAGITREHILDRTTGDLLQGRLTTPHRDTIGIVIYGVTDGLGERPS